jgi:hypothetical protein
VDLRQGCFLIGKIAGELSWTPGDRVKNILKGFSNTPSLVHCGSDVLLSCASLEMQIGSKLAQMT